MEAFRATGQLDPQPFGSGERGRPLDPQPFDSGREGVPHRKCTNSRQDGTETRTPQYVVSGEPVAFSSGLNFKVLRRRPTERMMNGYPQAVGTPGV